MLADRFPWTRYGTVIDVGAAEGCVPVRLARRHPHLTGDFFREPLPAGGAVVVYDQMIDDERRRNAAGLLASLNIALETEAGAGYTGADCRAWLQRTGFRTPYLEHLTGPHSMVVGLR